MKQAWIICHDSFLDHRLFFFENVFNDKGFQTKIIAGPRELDRYFSPEIREVIRPETCQEIFSFKSGNQSEKESDSLTVGDRFVIYGLMKLLTKINKLMAENDKRISNATELKSVFRKILGSLFGQSFITAVSCDDDNFIVRVYSKKNKRSYELDSRTMKIIMCESCEPKVVDDSLVEFNDHVYNYRSIFTAVENALDEGALKPPTLLYVADLPLLPLAIHYKNKFNVPLILDCHEWWKEQHIVWGNGDVSQTNRYDLYERKLYPQADLILTVGSILADDMSKYYKLPIHCVYTCDSIGYKESFDRTSFWKRNIPNYNGEKICLFQGSMTHARGLDNLAKMTKYLGDNVLLVVAGDGSYAKEFLKIAKTQGNVERLRYLGWKTQAELLEITNNADLGVIPYVAQNRYYATGAPNKLFEFLNAKLPMVYDQSMLEVDAIVRGNGLGLSVDMKNPSKSGKSITEYVSNANSVEDARAAYDRLGDKYFFEGQKRVFEDLAGIFLK